jgi:hypothetical protein
MGTCTCFSLLRPPLRNKDTSSCSSRRPSRPALACGTTAAPSPPPAPGGFLAMQGGRPRPTYLDGREHGRGSAGFAPSADGVLTDLSGSGSCSPRWFTSASGRERAFWDRYVLEETFPGSTSRTSSTGNECSFSSLLNLAYMVMFTAAQKTPQNAPACEIQPFRVQRIVRSSIVSSSMARGRIVQQRHPRRPPAQESQRSPGVARS